MDDIDKGSKDNWACTVNCASASASACGNSSRVHCCKLATSKEDQAESAHATSAEGEEASCRLVLLFLGHSCLLKICDQKGREKRRIYLQRESIDCLLRETECNGHAREVSGGGKERERETSRSTIIRSVGQPEGGGGGGIEWNARKSKCVSTST